MKTIARIFSIWFALTASAWAAKTTTVPLFQLTYDDAAKSIAEMLESKGAGEHVQVIINGSDNTPLFKHDKPITAQMTGLRYHEKALSWSGNLLFVSDGKVVSAIPLAGRYQTMVEVPVLKQRLGRNDVITSDDIEMKLISQSRSRSDVILQAADLVGQSPIRTISPLRPVRKHEISNPAVIHKNTLVKMVFNTGGINISTSGMAMEEGAKGQMIAVRNLTSNRIVHALIESDGIVRVGPTPAPSVADLKRMVPQYDKHDKVTNNLPTPQEELRYAIN